jgi:hypothetical protein
MYGFVYIWENVQNSMKYIGSHYGDINDGYVASGTYFLEYYNVNPQSFFRKIIKDGLSREEALHEEEYLLKKVDAMHNPMYYNLHNHVGKGWSHHDNPELREIYYARISQSKKGKQAWNKGKNIWTDANRHKLRIDTWLIIDPKDNEFEIDNMLDFCKTHNLNPSAMSGVARGKRRMHKGYRCKKLTNNRDIEYEYVAWKSKGKPGKAMFGSNNGWAKSITVEGVEYGSMREAVDATGLSMYKLRKLRNDTDE